MKRQKYNLTILQHYMLVNFCKPDLYNHLLDFAISVNTDTSVDQEHTTLKELKTIVKTEKSAKKLTSLWRLLRAFKMAEDAMILPAMSRRSSYMLVRFDNATSWTVVSRDLYSAGVFDSFKTPTTIELARSSNMFLPLFLINRSKVNIISSRLFIPDTGPSLILHNSRFGD